MAKVYRMRRYSAAEILIRADRLAARADDPSSPDDPAWVRLRANAVRSFGLARERAHERRAEERRKHAAPDTTRQQP